MKLPKEFEEPFLASVWILDENHVPRHPQTVDEWLLFQDEDRHVGLDQVGDIKISTVFLGIGRGRLRWGDNGPEEEALPDLFETAVFPQDGDIRIVARCKTWDRALELHKQVVEQMKLERGRP